MKTYKHLWEKLITKSNFELAYQKSIKGKSKQRQIRKFNENKEENLEAVRQSVINGTFHTSEYREMKIYEPKERTIYKLPYSPDRIVQHAIMNILESILTNLMIENTYACIQDRGQIAASHKTSEYVRKYKYCLKCDIHKFYPSISQSKVSAMFHRIIKDDKFMALVDDVIFSFPGGYNCPIGNYLSQWCGNFYLTSLDNYVLHTLKPSGYVRFCDDFMLFSNDKQFLTECRKKIEVFLWETLELRYSKADVFNVKQGVDFCGYRHFKKYVLIRKRTSKRIIRRFRKINKKVHNDDFNFEKAEGRIASDNGIMEHACAHHLRVSIKYDETKALVLEEKEKKNEKSNLERRYDLPDYGRQQRSECVHPS